MKGLRFAVAAAPRSGTRWASKVFGALGLVCHHEGIFTHKGVDHWVLASGPDGDSSCYAALYGGQVPVGLWLHQLREPRAQVASLYNYLATVRRLARRPSWAAWLGRQEEILSALVPERDLDALKRLGLLWLRLNRMIEALPGDRIPYRLGELGLRELVQIVEALGLPLPRTSALSAALRTPPLYTRSEVEALVQRALRAEPGAPGRIAVVQPEDVELLPEVEDAAGVYGFRT